MLNCVTFVLTIAKQFNVSRNTANSLHPARMTPNSHMTTAPDAAERNPCSSPCGQRPDAMRFTQPPLGSCLDTLQRIRSGGRWIFIWIVCATPTRVIIRPVTGRKHSSCMGAAVIWKQLWHRRLNHYCRRSVHAFLKLCHSKAWTRG